MTFIEEIFTIYCKTDDLYSKKIMSGGIVVYPVFFPSINRVPFLLDFRQKSFAHWGVNFLVGDDVSHFSRYLPATSIQQHCQANFAHILFFSVLDLQKTMKLIKIRIQDQTVGL